MFDDLVHFVSQFGHDAARSRSIARAALAYTRTTLTALYQPVDWNTHATRSLAFVTASRYAGGNPRRL